MFINNTFLTKFMIFRTNDGRLIELNINDFITDSEYYNEIMKLKI